MKKQSLVLSWLLFIPTVIFAATINQAFVDEQNEHYLINLVIQVDSPKQSLIDVLTNYGQLNELSETIISSQLLEQKANTAKVKLVSEGCIFLFCKTITQVQNVSHIGDNDLIVNVESLADNIKSGVHYWRFKSIDENKTLVTYSADIEPDFWVPSFLGSWLFQNRLLDEATEIISNAETIANQQSVDKE